MSDCGVPFLGALAALVTAIGALVVAWSKVLEARVKAMRSERSHEERDKAVARALRPRRPTKDGVSPIMWRGLDRARDTSRYAISDTAWLDNVAEQEGWRKQ